MHPSTLPTLATSKTGKLIGLFFVICAIKWSLLQYNVSTSGNCNPLSGCVNMNSTFQIQTGDLTLEGSIL
jgi:hypothetical protein